MLSPPGPGHDLGRTVGHGRHAVEGVVQGLGLLAYRGQGILLFRLVAEAGVELVGEELDVDPVEAAQAVESGLQLRPAWIQVDGQDPGAVGGRLEKAPRMGNQPPPFLSSVIPGREGKLPSLPPHRTVRARLTHTAPRSMGSLRVTVHDPRRR